MLLEISVRPTGNALLNQKRGGMSRRLNSNAGASNGSPKDYYAARRAKCRSPFVNRLSHCLGGMGEGRGYFPAARGGSRSVILKPERSLPDPRALAIIRWLVVRSSRNPDAKACATPSLGQDRRGFNSRSKAKLTTCIAEEGQPMP